MNKKFLSAILFGALMVTSTGTFVSCKDYDDDIDNLQEQINKLATKEDMTSQIATLQAALTAAAKDASDAISKATAAEVAAKAAGDDAAAAKAAADKSVAEAKAEAIKAVKAEVDAAKADLEKLVTDGLAESKAEMEEMAKKLADATKKVEDIVGKIADMVTAVELVVSQNFTVEGKSWTGKTLQFMTAIEKENVFGKGLPGAMTFTKGEQVQTGDFFIVRVSPTNAVVTPEMVSLIDGEGNTLDDFLTVESVEPYNEQILGGIAQPQARAASTSGLWKVSVALKNYNKDTWNATTMVQTTTDSYQYKRFAVEINNTLSTASTREVLSSFDLQLAKEDFKPLGELNYWVGAKNVTEIRNRYATTESEADGGLAIKTENEELIWTNVNDPRTSVKRASDGKPASDSNAKQANNATTNDNRSNVRYIYPAVQGTAFTVSIDEMYNTNINKKAAPSQVKGMYVVLDTRNAIESKPSEINAWKSYDIKGIDEVVPGTSTKITINGANTINDIIGFRVYAVNYDGTLVDPDGRAFYVRLGNAAADWNATATTVTAGIAAANSVPSAKANVSLTKISEAATVDWTTDKDENGENPAFHFAIYKADESELYNSAKSYTPAQLAAIKFQDAAYIKTTPKCTDWLHYKDNKTYNGVLTIKNANDFVLATIKVSMTKVLPTTMPVGYSLKDKQVINGIYNCYMIADNWTATKAKTGEMAIENLINFGNDVTKGANYVVKFAESADDANNDGVKETLSPAGDEKIVVAKGYVDNKTEHATSVFYNYGKISTETVDENNKVIDYMVAGDSFKTVYCCFYKEAVHTWDWATRAQLGGNYNKKDEDGNWLANPLSTTLTYGNPVDKDGNATETGAYNAMIFGKNAIDGTFSTLLSKVYESSLEVKSAKLISDATQKEDYFSVTTDLKFKPIKTDLGSNPKENVPSTLIINCKDSYNHDVVITLKMTVAPRK